MLISKHYQQQLHTVHSSRSWGDVGHTHANTIHKLYTLYRAKSILDYGCGAGRLASTLERRGIGVTNYDPGVAHWSNTPAPHDIVVCTDVLEHVEPLCLEAVLRDLRRVTVCAAWVTICGVPARQRLPDGRNAHLIQEQAEWWEPRLERAKFRIVQSNSKLMQYLLEPRH